MLILLINSAFQSSVSIVFLKLTTELFATETVKDHIIMLFLLGICMLITMLSTVHSLNLAMKHFDQLEVMPIYMTIIMIFWMLSGMIILRESSKYTTSQFFGIFGSILVCCIGIKVLISKIKTQRMQKYLDRTNAADEDESIDE